MLGFILLNISRLTCCYLRLPTFTLAATRFTPIGRIAYYKDSTIISNNKQNLKFLCKISLLLLYFLLHSSFIVLLACPKSTKRSSTAKSCGLGPRRSLSDHERLRFSHDRSGRSRRGRRCIRTFRSAVGTQCLSQSLRHIIYKYIAALWEPRGPQPPAAEARPWRPSAGCNPLFHSHSLFLTVSEPGYNILLYAL